jgi:heme oxygenase
MASPFEALFGGAPERVDPTVGFKSYFNTAGSLNTLRDQRIKNALNQIKLNYAPQMAQQGADLGAANVSIKQNEAKYAPQMSLADLAQKHAATMADRLRSQGEYLDNITKKAEANGAPAKVQAALNLQQAQIKLALAHAQSFLSKGKAPAPAKGAPTYLDLKGNPLLGGAQQMGAPQTPGMGAPTQGVPQQMPNVASAAQPATQNNATAPQSEEDTFPGADPKAPNILQSVGPSDSRGHAAAYLNPHTGERFTVLTPTGREKMRNQLVALRQAIPYIDDLKKYGTVGKIGPSGKNELLPNAFGGVPRGVGAEYDKALAAATEHVMTGSQLQKTDATVNMVNTILNRQNFESREDYTNRMNKFQQHLKELDENTKNSLGLNMMSLDKYTSDNEQKYVTDEYNKITNDTVNVISPDGKEGTIPRSNLEKALARGYKRAS